MMDTAEEDALLGSAFALLQHRRNVDLKPIALFFASKLNSSSFYSDEVKVQMAFKMITIIERAKKSSAELELMLILIA